MLKSVPFAKPVQMKAWRIPRSEIPPPGDEQVEWLFDVWADVDTWVADHKE